MAKYIGVGVGPMSVEIIDAVIKFANRYDRPMMLIASRNQIECAELGGGYVGGFNTQTFYQYVRERDYGSKVIVCRDHCGPHLNDAEKNMSYEEAMERTLESARADMYYMDYIHVDVSAVAEENQRDCAERLFMQHLLSSKPHEFEFGTEENIGSAVSVEKFERDILFVRSLFEGFINPLYVVGQTGSLVKSTYQVGNFNEDVVRRLVEVATKHGVKLKEHNADYISPVDVQKRVDLGVGAINVAPEFGVAQTQVLIELARKTKANDLLWKFYQEVLDGGKWQKWAWGNTFDEGEKILCAGHYHFTSQAYMDLVGHINERVNYYEAVEHRITDLLLNYAL